MAPSGSTHCQGRGRVGCRTCVDRRHWQHPHGLCHLPQRRQGGRDGQHRLHRHQVGARHLHLHRAGPLRRQSRLNSERHGTGEHSQGRALFRPHATAGRHHPQQARNPWLAAARRPAQAARHTALRQGPVRRCTGLRRGGLLLCRCGIRCRRPCTLPRHDTRLGERLY